MLCGAFIDPFCASQATKMKTTIHKVTNNLILFLEEVSYAAHQGMIDLIKNILTLKKNLLILWHAEFSASTAPVFSVTLSFRIDFNMLIWCSSNISDYIQCWKQLCCLIFLWNPWYFQDSLTNRQ